MWFVSFVMHEPVFHNPLSRRLVASAFSTAANSARPPCPIRANASVQDSAGRGTSKRAVLLHRTHFDVVLWEPVLELRAASQRIDKAPMPPISSGPR